MNAHKNITTIPALRRRNTSSILTEAWKSGRTTRAELARATSLTSNTVSNIVNKLLRDTVFVLAGKENSTGGRQPDIIQFNPGCRYVIGISIGVYRTKGVITDLYGKTHKECLREIGDVDDRQDVLNRLSEVMDELLDNFPGNMVYGVGISFPGTVNHITGVVMDSSIIGNALDVNIKRFIEERYRLPAFVENNVNLCALNEALLGKGKGKSIVLFIFAGYGIGSGLTIQGNIYEGARDSAGNLGHIVIEPNGRRCYCGSYGCMETVASFPALFDFYQKNIKIGAKADYTEIIHESFSVENVQRIFEYARNGDELALNALQNVGLYIGIATANLIGLFNPDIVVFGGEYADVQDIILPVIQDSVKTRAWVTIKDTEMTFSDYGFDADLYGAVSLAIKQFLETGITIL